MWSVRAPRSVPVVKRLDPARNFPPSADTQRRPIGSTGLGHRTPGQHTDEVGAIGGIAVHVAHHVGRVGSNSRQRLRRPGLGERRLHRLVAENAVAAGARHGDTRARACLRHGNTDQRRDTVSVVNGPAPEIVILKNATEERDAVAKWLAARSKDGVVPEEIGVFVRSPAELDRAKAAVEKAKLEHKVLDDGPHSRGGQSRRSESERSGAILRAAVHH